MARFSMSARKRRRIWNVLIERHEGRLWCFWCGSAVQRGASRMSERATLDHVIPRSQGGPTTADNIVVACASCNHNRGTLGADEFVLSRYLARRIQWRAAP